jgi:hypothetical protein
MPVAATGDDIQPPSASPRLGAAATLRVAVLGKLFVIDCLAQYPTSTSAQCVGGGTGGPCGLLVTGEMLSHLYAAGM